MERKHLADVEPVEVNKEGFKGHVSPLSLDCG